MPQVHVLTIVGREHLHEWSGRGFVTDSPKRLRGEEANSRGFVAEQRDQRIARGRIPDVADAAGPPAHRSRHRHRGRNGVRCAALRAVLARELAETPECMNARELMRAVTGDGEQQCSGCPACDQLELGLLPDAHVDMPQQCRRDPPAIRP